MTPLKVGQKWLTRDGYEAIIRDIGTTGSHPVRVDVPQFDDTINVSLDGKGRTTSDDLIELISDVAGAP